MPKMLASLSLDLDNKWAYLKTHGDPGWEGYPSFLEVVTPRFLRVLEELSLRITVFVVGQDAALENNRSALTCIAAAGHEIGNHSFHHEPWLHRYSDKQLEEDLSAAEEAIEAATGMRPIGFRGPGYSLSPAVIGSLIRRGYRYDASTLPTFLGPFARTYYFLTAQLSSRQRAERKQLFGNWTEGLRLVRPYWWQIGSQRLLEIPVTTLPLLRTPIHVSYLLFLRQFSRALAWGYWRFAMELCRLTGVQPSLLLHPLDFLGGDEEPDLAFFPAMRMRGAEKSAFVRDVLADFARQFQVVPLAEQAAALISQDNLPVRSAPEWSPPGPSATTSSVTPVFAAEAARR
jgi:hypothetical protein